MGQTFRKFQGDSFSDAYQQMVSELGEHALVLNTSEVKKRGILGLLGQRVVELTAAAPTPASPQSHTTGPRKRTPLESKYAAQAAQPARSGTVASDETVNSTVAYFRELVSDAQAGVAAPSGRTSAPSPGGAKSRAPVIPLRRPGEISPWYRVLVNRGVPEKLAANLVRRAANRSAPGAAHNAKALSKHLNLEIRKRVSVTGGISVTPGTRHTVALVGATGVGKTTNLAKLAAQFAFREHLRVAFLTVDTYRVAAPEQLRVYANILELPMRIANDPKEVASAMYAFRDYELVLIDTAGSSQFNLEQLQELKAMLTVAQPQEVLLVVSANTQLEDSRSVVDNFKFLKPTSLLFSKLDETRHYGGLFALHTEAGLPLSYFSVGQNVPDDIGLASPAEVAELLLEGGMNRGRSSAQTS